MQVFIPYPDFEKSVQALDDTRLRKQAQETTQLLDIMLGFPTKTGKPRTGWLNHPALLAWQSTPGALIEHLIYNVIEIEKRGFKTDYVASRLKAYETITVSSKRPAWLGNEIIHSSHRVRLLQKCFEEIYKYGEQRFSTLEWYSSFNWKETEHHNFFNEEYWWPTYISGDTYCLNQKKLNKDALNFKQLLIEKFGLNPFVR